MAKKKGARGLVIRRFGAQCRITCDGLTPVAKLRSYLLLNHECKADAFTVRLELVRNRDDQRTSIELDECLDHDWTPPRFCISGAVIANEVREDKTHWGDLGEVLARELLNRSASVVVEAAGDEVWIEVAAPGYNTSASIRLRKLKNFLRPK